MTLETTLRKKIITTLAEGNSFSIHTHPKQFTFKLDDFAMNILREMEEEGLIVSDPSGYYKIKS
jgi:ATP-dependent DNA helicase RecQ